MLNQIAFLLSYFESLRIGTVFNYLHAGQLLMFLLSSVDFFHNQIFQNILSVTLSEDRDQS